MKFKLIKIKYLKKKLKICKLLKFQNKMYFKKLPKNRYLRIAKIQKI